MLGYFSKIYQRLIAECSGFWRRMLLYSLEQAWREYLHFDYVDLRANPGCPLKIQMSLLISIHRLCIRPDHWIISHPKHTKHLWFPTHLCKPFDFTWNRLLSEGTFSRWGVPLCFILGSPSWHSLAYICILMLWAFSSNLFPGLMEPFSVANHVLNLYYLSSSWDLLHGYNWLHSALLCP